MFKYCLQDCKRLTKRKDRKKGWRNVMHKEQETESGCKIHTQHLGLLIQCMLLCTSHFSTTAILRCRAFRHFPLSHLMSMWSRWAISAAASLPPLESQGWRWVEIKRDCYPLQSQSLWTETNERNSETKTSTASPLCPQRIHSIRKMANLALGMKGGERKKENWTGLKRPRVHSFECLSA